MRELTGFEVEGATTGTRIEVLDEPGSGGANHRYAIEWPDDGAITGIVVEFQNGPVREAGVNGVTQEQLLAVVIDRLECFQAGPFPTFANAQALEHAKLAMEYLHDRTRDRVKRNVEGKAAA